MAGKILGNGSDDAGVEEHAGLGRSGRQFPQQRLHLEPHERLRHRVDTGDSSRCLGRQAGDRAGAVDAQSRKHFEIGLDPGPSSTVGPGDGQCDRPKHVSILHERKSGILGSPCKVRRRIALVPQCHPSIDRIGSLRAAR